MCHKMLPRKKFVDTQKTVKQAQPEITHTVQTSTNYHLELVYTITTMRTIILLQTEQHSAEVWNDSTQNLNVPL